MAAREQHVMVCEGEWDIARAEEFARRANDALASRAALIILDFRPATFVDASTVGAICALARTASKRGMAVAVVRGSGIVGRVFELARLADVLPVAATPEHALRGARLAVRLP